PPDPALRSDPVPDAPPIHAWIGARLAPRPAELHPWHGAFHGPSSPILTADASGRIVPGSSGVEIRAGLREPVIEAVKRHAIENGTPPHVPPGRARRRPQPGGSRSARRRGAAGEPGAADLPRRAGAGRARVPGLRVMDPRGAVGRDGVR